MTSTNFHDFWPLPSYHRHSSKMLMKGIFDPYVLWPFDHRPMGTPLPLKTCWLLKWIVTLELELSLCQLLCTPLYIGALSTVGADLELCTGVHDKMDFEDPIVKDQLRSGRGGKIKENQRPFYFTVQPRPQPTELIFHFIKSRDQTSVLLSVTWTYLLSIMIC